MIRKRTLFENASEPIPISDSQACDVVFYNADLDDLVIRRDLKDWQKNEIPVGIVVIPASHNVYGNGACGVMSLMSASYQTPDMGSIFNQVLCWGQYDTDISELYNYIGCSSYGNQDTWTAVQYHAGNAYLPSDQSSFGVKLMNKLPGSDQNCWYFYNNDYHHAPSPYLNNGSRNPDYYNTEINTDNVLSDFKGKLNTAVLISYATAQSDWKTASSITNNENQGYSPAACACWRYSTTGTKQGDWYLPAMGELGYTFVRFQKINDIISELQRYFDKTFCLLDTNDHWSSSECSRKEVWRLNFEKGNVNHGYTKKYSGFVRPFMQLKEEYVDMGLSVKWATCNIGANAPHERGWYFQWAGTTPYNSDCTPVGGGSAIIFDYNLNCPYWVSGTSSGSTIWSKYTKTYYDIILEPEDDAAHAHIGGDCRMPTEAEYNELLRACTTTWVTNYNGTGINGRLFTLKTDPSKTLFFPALGYLDWSSLRGAGSHGVYWSSSIYSHDASGGWGLYFVSDSCYMNYYYRYYGAAVRAVKPK